MSIVFKIVDDIDKGVSCSHTMVAKVVKYYGPVLRTYFYNRLRSHDEVDDYLQELYCRVLVYKRPGEIKSIQKFVFTIAVNLMRDRSRRVNTRMEKMTISVDEVEDISRAWCGDHGPEKTLSDQQTIQQAQLIIDQVYPVSGKAKEAFYLNKIVGLNQKETALKLGVTVSAIEKYMMKIKQELQSIEL